ncbi:MAG: succinyl-CoA--3-ketoacid-CoA transferase [Bacteroidetes bacterium]|nr:MAG: succinyl-CoA--3-ketoacid-CoA transferase [Bacteroidota bacterium]
MDKQQIRETIAQRVARELHDGDVVHLGEGLPKMVSCYIDADSGVMLLSESGVVGVDPVSVGARLSGGCRDGQGAAILLSPNAATFDSAMSHALMRGGHLDVCVLGAFEVDAKGNLANWIVPRTLVQGMGAAMDPLHGSKKVIVAMEHTAEGKHKIVQKCSLPLTGVGHVNLIVTEMCVIEVRPEGLVVIELNPQFSKEQVVAATGARLTWSPELIPMT